MQTYQQPNNSLMEGTPISQLKPKQNEYQQNYNVEHISMQELASDINNNLTETKQHFPEAKHNVSTHQEESEIDTDIETSFDNLISKNNLNETISSIIPSHINEYIILIILFYIVSNDSVREIITTYVKQFSANPDGKYGSLAIILYGVVLAVLFFLSKKLIS